MSRVLWAEALVPANDATPQSLSPEIYGEFGIHIPATFPLMMANTDIPLPDGRAYRSMSRAAVLMSAVCLKAESVLAPYLAQDPFSVGLYCAVDNGPTDYPSTRELNSVSREEFAERYRKLRNPKTYLKQLPNLAAAQIGIFLKIQGLMNVYTHSLMAGWQSLEQAELDLDSGLVKTALVCTGFSFEDALETLRSYRQTPKGLILSEGAGAMVLVRDGKRTAWKPNSLSDPPAGHSTPTGRFYGIGNPVINLALRSTNHGK